MGKTSGKSSVALVQTIAVLCEVAPAEFLRHLDVVMPYLKADNSVSREQESQIVTEICDMIFRLAPIVTEGDMQRMAEGSVIDDLVSITYKFGSGPLIFSVRALAVLANRTGSENDNPIAKRLMKLVSTFYGYLLKTKRSGRDISTCSVSHSLDITGGIIKTSVPQPPFSPKLLGKDKKQHQSSSQRLGRVLSKSP